MSLSISRRQWLVRSGLSAGAGLLLPSSLLAGPVTEDFLRDADALAMQGDFSLFEKRATLLRRAAGPIRLHFNENPFGMSAKAKAAMMDAYSEHNKYGSSSGPDLAAVFAKQIGVAPECVLVTQGSQEVLSIAAIAYGMHNGDIMAASPTFEGLLTYAEAIGARVTRVPLDKNLAHDLDAMDRTLTNAMDLVFVCNPNNPTGTLVNNAKLRDFVTSASRRAVVLVDEAYHDFVEDPTYKSLVDMVAHGDNVIISRTASKIHGMAGMRVGFAIARPDIISRLANKTTGSVNSMAARATIASVNDIAFQDFCRAKNKEGRAMLVTALEKLGRRVAPSHTNFLFFHAGMPVESFQRAMQAKGFIVGRAFPPYRDWVRVSIGTPEEMQSFVAALPDAMRTAAGG